MVEEEEGKEYPKTENTKLSKMKEWKHIKVTPRTWKILKQLKLDTGKRSIDEVIRELLEKCFVSTF